jgi:hypothetical protein
LWAVLTAVIVTQMSVGRSLKATFDYLAGTLGGAIYGGAIGGLVPHSNEMALLAGQLLVRTAGLEPAQGFPQGILSPLRLPFRHVRGADIYNTSAEADIYNTSARRLLSA